MQHLPVSVFRSAVQAAEVSVRQLQCGEDDHGVPVGPSGVSRGTRHLSLLQRLV